VLLQISCSIYSTCNATFAIVYCYLHAPVVDHEVSHLSWRVAAVHTAIVNSQVELIDYALFTL
jgi:hypothetical protein